MASDPKRNEPSSGENRSIQPRRGIRIAIKRNSLTGAASPIESVLEKRDDNRGRPNTKEKTVLRRHLQKKEEKERKAHHKIRHIQGTSTVTGREAEYKSIEKQVTSFLANGVGFVLYVTGVPGSGKTFTAISLLKFHKVNFVYLNCSVLRTKTEIFREICQCTPCFRERRQDLPALREHYGTCENRHLLVIDEVDFLTTKNERLLYNIFELPFLEDAAVMLIVISNTLGSLSSKVESRIGTNRLEFKPYDSAQLKRVVLSQAGGRPIDERSLDLITKKVAASTGDIRKAKDLVEAAGSAGISKTGAILRDASCPLLTKFVLSFNRYQKLLLHLNRAPKARLSEWFDTFRAFCMAKSVKPLEYSDFLYVLNDLASFGIYTLRGDGWVVCNYLDEEIEQATKGDADFLKFKSTKL